jgi:hypothetical protein
MSSPVISLAIFSGYWGQVFEYWPFTFLVAVTIVYAIVAFGSDMISKRRWKPPAGATPRMEFAIDPATIAKPQFRTGLYLIRFGSAVAVAATGLFCFLAFNPLAIGNNYGLTQQINNATATGTSISVVAASLAFIAAICVRKMPIPILGFILVAIGVAIFAPGIANGQPRWLGLMAAALSAPSAMVVIGTLIAFKRYAGSRKPIAYIVPSAPPPPIGVA